ncbi:MAG: sensor histidine kinase [Candidatus Nitrosomaritimum yanchengensis]
MSQAQSQNGVLSVWLISLGSILTLIAGLYFININIGIDDFSNIVSLPVYTIIPGTLVVLSIWAVIKSDTITKLPKNSLISLTFAFSCWFIAEQTWNLYEHVLEIDPYPSAADFFYLAAPLFMFIALLIFLKDKKTSKKSLIISSIISLLILIPSIIVTLEASVEDEIFEIIVAIVYPVVDAIMLVPVIIIIGFLISKKGDFFWIMIISGIIIMLVADTGFLFLVISDEYVDGHPIDILWVSAYTIWTFMMLYLIIQSKKSKIEEFLEINKKQNPRKVERYGVLIALFLINITVILLLAGINYFIEPREDTILEFFSWILAMMVIIFSSIVIIMNSRLNRALQKKTEQLEETTDELIKSERFSAIGEFASRIAHDIRNPLSNIHMSIELMKNSPPDTKLNDQQINEKLELVSKNIERISHQVNDVLGYVKNQTASKKIIKISKCIQESIETITIPPNITVKIPKSEMTIWADPFQMQIVFNNIIINAIQSLEKNPGKIIFRFSETESKTRIEIENSGPEIPKGMLPHIFDSLVTTKQIGTGLGLVSCKTIVENHQGIISAKNNPTTFIIEIPKKN